MSKRISFDRSLYLPEAVEAAAAAYAEYAEIEVTLTADAAVAVVSGVEGNDPDLVANAFCNHVLHESIARMRQATLREVG
jgi:hypothetical protein